MSLRLVCAFQFACRPSSFGLGCDFRFANAFGSSGFGQHAPESTSLQPCVSVWSDELGCGYPARTMTTGCRSCALGPTPGPDALMCSRQFRKLCKVGWALLDIRIAAF